MSSRYVEKMRKRAKRRMRITHRRVNTRVTKETFLIVCERHRTEPNYFKGFRLSSAKVYAYDYTADNLVIKAIQLKRQFRDQEDMYFDQVWCVLDTEHTNVTNFKNALALAHKNNIKIAYANNAIELWYSLHFYYHDLQVTREVYKGFLSILLGYQYQKDNQDIYYQLLKHQPVALENAKKLMQAYSKHVPFENNPSTNIFKLVEELNKFVPQKR